MKEFIDKLIKRLKAGVDKECVSSVPKIRLCDAISIVNELAEEYKGGWIPCSKKRPEAGTHRDVWISIENEVVAYRAKWYLDHFEWENGWVIKEPILAWMPNDVPEAYQPKGE